MAVIGSWFKQGSRVEACASVSEGKCGLGAMRRLVGEEWMNLVESWLPFAGLWRVR